MFAAEMGHTRVVDTLVKNGADKNATDMVSEPKNCKSVLRSWKPR
jgi:hypothetical protein